MLAKCCLWQNGVRYGVCTLLPRRGPSGVRRALATYHDSRATSLLRCLSRRARQAIRRQPSSPHSCRRLPAPSRSRPSLPAPHTVPNGTCRDTTSPHLLFVVVLPWPMIGFPPAIVNFLCGKCTPDPILSLHAPSWSFAALSTLARAAGAILYIVNRKKDGVAPRRNPWATV